MARAAAGRVEGHLLHTAHVDPDRWQDPTGTHATRESLVEYYSVSHT